MQVLLLAVPSMALALPQEDHWSVEMEPAAAAALAQSRQLIEEERYGEALPILEGLAQELPANADVFNLLGVAHRKTGNLTVSGAHYARALYLDPEHLGALEYQGELFLMLGDLEGALGNLERLEALCATPCEERDELNEAIRAWQAR